MVTISATTADGRDMTAKLNHFARVIGLEAAARGRYSMLLVLGLFGGLKSGHLNPAKVVYEIQALEGIGKPSHLKRPEPFRHPPLKGLWHKHYLEDGRRAVVLNFQRALKKYSLPLAKQRIREAQKAGVKRDFEIADIKAIVDDAVQGNWLRLARANALTGEWIVFARHQGKNYYLCLGTHDKSQHGHLRAQIDNLCCQEFPFLSALLAGA
jgi:hypothetical protein